MWNERSRAVAGLLLVQLMFGVHYFAAKIVLLEIPPRSWAVLRAAGATAVLWLMVRALGQRPRLSWPDIGRLALFSIFGVIVNQLCFVEGLSRTSATHASILITAIPVGTLVFAVLLRREPLTRAKVLSLAFATAGIVLVVQPWIAPATTAGTAPVAGPSLLGDGLVLINALSYALFLVISKRVLVRVAPVPATAVVMGFGTLGLLALGSSDLVRFDPATVSTYAWTWAVFIVAFPTALGYMLNYWALKRVDASVVGLFIYLQPVIATALAVVFLGERPGAAALLGALLIFAGVHLALRPARNSPAPAA